VKVVGVLGNTSGRPGQVTEPQGYFVSTDSAIVYSPRPLFLPDWAKRFTAQAAIAVRICRLGKCIAPRFAHRYWDAATVALRTTPHDAPTASDTLANVWDGAIVVGQWVNIDHDTPHEHLAMQACIDDNEVWTATMGQLQCPVDHVIAHVSRHCTLKMGDIVMLGMLEPEHTLTRNTRLTATLQGQQVMRLWIK